MADWAEEVRWQYLGRAAEPAAVAQTSGFYAIQAVEKLTNAIRANDPACAPLT